MYYYIFDFFKNQMKFIDFYLKNCFVFDLLKTNSRLWFQNSFTNSAMVKYMWEVSTLDEFIINVPY